MKLTSEQLTKAKAVKSAEELLALARENGVDLTEEEAAGYFSELHREGILADDELDNVSGGCGGSSEPIKESQPNNPPVFAYGESVFVIKEERWGVIEVIYWNTDYNMWRYKVVSQTAYGRKEGTYAAEELSRSALSR